MIILGIDPGFDRLGCAILKKDKTSTKLVHSVCLVSDRNSVYEKRIFSLGKKIENIIRKHRPEIVAIEKIFFAKNQKTAIQVAEVRGMILYLASLHSIPVMEFTPLQIKAAVTGYGKAEKSQIYKVIKSELKLENIPKDDDETDAIAVAITASLYLSTTRI